MNAQEIDKFLKNHGSPLAGHGKTFVAAGRKYGVDPRLVVAISGIESSFGKHTFRPYNAWGWMSGKGWGSWEEGITTVTKGLRSGYLDRGLTTPDQIVHRYAPASDGNDTENWVRVVNQYYGELGGSPKKGAKTPAMSPVPVTNPQAPALPSLPPLDTSSFVRENALSNLSDIASGKFDPGKMLGRAVDTQASISAARAQRKAQEEWLASLPKQTPEVYTDPEGRGAATRGGKAFTYDGKVLQPGVSWNGTHVTDNLDWNNGRKSAIDIIKPAGTPVGAPMNGTIVRWGSAQGGQSLYFRGSDGTMFWMGHIDQRLPVGTKVKAGQPIAVISADHETPHLHIDRKY